MTYLSQRGKHIWGDIGWGCNVDLQGLISRQNDLVAMRFVNDESHTVIQVHRCGDWLI